VALAPGLRSSLKGGGGGPGACGTTPPLGPLVQLRAEGGGREGIEAGRWLREVCEVPIVFVTGYDDPDTIQRIHEQVPGAPVLSKPEYRKGLAAAVDDAIEHRIA
jgi:DNA-binding NarL/FixJ family response regulator